MGCGRWGVQAHSKAMKAATEMFSDKSGLDDKAMAAFLRQAYTIFSHENALNPTAFPSLRQFETETVSMYDPPPLLSPPQHTPAFPLAPLHSRLHSPFPSARRASSTAFPTRFLPP